MTKVIIMRYAYAFVRRKKTEEMELESERTNTRVVGTVSKTKNRSGEKT